jgi:hypothetical protein
MFTKETITKNLRIVSLGATYVIQSGLLEITYNSGARVVLQGPAVYEVDGRNSGYLKSGTAVVLCKVRAKEQGAKNEKGPQAGSPMSPPNDSQVFCLHTPQSSGMRFSIQDTDVVVMVDPQGEVFARALSPTRMSVPDSPILTKHLEMPGNRRVAVGVFAPDGKPAIVIDRGVPPPKTAPGAPAEATVYSGDSPEKKPPDGAAKRANRGPDS